MKFIHLSDLHLGKRLNDYSLIDDQAYILERITDIVAAEKPYGVFIAGDVYDKTVPSADAVQLFDDFLTRLADMSVKVFVVSGNHDSPERLSFGGRLMTSRGVYMAPSYGGEVSPIECVNGCERVNVYLMPFVKPAHVRRFCEEGDISTYTDALAYAVRTMRVDKSLNNVLVAHQFVGNAEKGGSEEELSVGGLDCVDASVFADFDYVALGHIHRAQSLGNIRYCGTPLKYSFSEVNDVKSVTVAEISDKQCSVRTVPLTPKREMRQLRGSFDEIISPSYYRGTTYSEDYIRVILTDEDDIPNAVGRLRAVYPYLMRLDYDNTRTRADIQLDVAVERKSPLELFADFFRLQNNRELTREQSEFVARLLDRIEEGDR